MTDHAGSPVDLVRGALVDRRLRIERDRGDEVMAQCPAHDDRTPSLHVSTGDDGRALLTCHAGCLTETVLARLGIGWTDLYAPGFDPFGSVSSPTSAPSPESRCYKGQGTRDKGQGPG